MGISVFLSSLGYARAFLQQSTRREEPEAGCQLTLRGSRCSSGREPSVSGTSEENSLGQEHGRPASALLPSPSEHSLGYGTVCLALRRGWSPSPQGEKVGAGPSVLLRGSAEGQTVCPAWVCTLGLPHSAREVQPPPGGGEITPWLCRSRLKCGLPVG